MKRQLPLNKQTLTSLGNELFQMEMSKAENEDYITFSDSVMNKLCLLRSKLEKKRRNTHVNSITCKSLFCASLMTQFVQKIVKREENAEKVVPVILTRNYSLLPANTTFTENGKLRLHVSS